MTVLQQRFLRPLTFVLLVMAVPLFLFTTNLRVIINSGWLYSGLFAKYDSPSYTNITQPDLMDAAKQIKHYFNSNVEPLKVVEPVAGVPQELFTPLEVRHMADVKGLVKGLLFWERLSFVYIALFAVLGLVLSGRAGIQRRLTKGLLYGSLLTLGILVLLGALSFVGFDTLFVKFHQISFSNDFWELPDNAMLLQMFPEGFFLDSTLIVAALTIAQALFTGGLCGAYLFVRRKTERGGPVGRPAPC